MIVTCEHCGARYKLDEAKLSGRGAKITCPRCKHVFFVYRGNRPPGAEEGSVVAGEGVGPAAAVAFPPGGASPSAGAPPPAAVPAPPAPARPDVNDLDFRKVGIQSWKVRVKIGLVYDFSDYRTLRRYIQDGRVTLTDLLSHDGKNWVPIGDVPDLAEYFIDVFLALQAGVDPQLPPTASRGSTPATGDARPQAGQRSAGSEPPPQGGASVLVHDTGPARIVIPMGAPPPPSQETASPASAPTLAASTQPGASVASVAIGATSGPSIQMPRPSLDTTASGRPAPPPTPPPRSGFDDPFEALKDRQRTRIESNMTGARESRERPQGLFSPSLILALLVFAGAIWAVWYTFQQKQNAPHEQAPTGNDIVKQRQLEQENQIRKERERKQKELEDTLNKVPDEEAGVAKGGSDLTPVGPASMMPAALAASPYAGEQAAARGDSATRSGNHRSAVAAFREAVEADPQNGIYQLKLGASMYRAGMRDEARTPLEAALRLGQPVAHKWLARVARDTGDHASAMQHYAEYLNNSTEPGSEPLDAAEIRSEMEALPG